MEMREALLYETLPGSRVRCHTCQWRCTISPGKLGVCRMLELCRGLFGSSRPHREKAPVSLLPGKPGLLIGHMGMQFSLPALSELADILCRPFLFRGITHHLSAGGHFHGKEGTLSWDCMDL